MLSPPAAMVVPSGDQVTDRAILWYSVRVVFCVPVIGSHKMMVPSSPPAARVAPSGDQATDQMFLWFPVRVAFSVPVVGPVNT